MAVLAVLPAVVVPRVDPVVLVVPVVLTVPAAPVVPTQVPSSQVVPRSSALRVVPRRREPLGPLQMVALLPTTVVPALTTAVPPSAELQSVVLPVLLEVLPSWVSAMPTLDSRAKMGTATLQSLTTTTTSQVTVPLTALLRKPPL